MSLDPLDGFGVKVGAVRGLTKRAVGAKTTRTSGDLGNLVCAQRSVPPPIKFRQARKGHMIDIHVKAHANRIGCDQKIDFTGLIKRDLRVAGARAKRAHDHCRAPLMAADQFGDGINFFLAEGDNGTTPRQLGDLFDAGIGQGR